MKRKLAIMTSVGLAAGLVSGCGGGGQGQAAGAGGGSGSTPPTSVSLTTLEVLSLAQKPSETAAPTNVDGGAVILSDTSETSEPVNINAM